MKFFIKRYMHGLSKRRVWLFLIPVLPILYLIFASVGADRFDVKQKVAISKDMPVALESNPVGFKAATDIIAAPEIFFQSNTAIKLLTKGTSSGIAPIWSEKQSMEVIHSVRNDMSIQMVGSNMAQVEYSGKNKQFGEALVNFYATRLVQRAREGIDRSNIAISSDQIPKLAGNMQVVEYRAPWRPERLAPFVQLLFLSVVAVLLLIGVMEWNDSSFKSERQLGRYLNIPVLGSVPDINRVSDMIHH